MSITMLRLAFVFAAVSLTFCQQCDQYNIFSQNVKNQCDCTRIVSEAVYRGGISSDIVKSDDVTANWDSSTNECKGCFTDPEGTFRYTLADNTNISYQESGCYQEAVQYTSYLTSVTPSMAAELPFSFTDCTDEDYAQDESSDEVSSGITPENPAPVPEEPATAPERPAPAPENPAPVPEEPAPTPEEPTPAPEEPTPAPEEPAPTPEEPAPAPEEPAPVPEEPAPTPEEPAPAPEEPAPVPEEPAPVPAPPPNGGCRGVALSLILFYITTFLAVFTLGQEGNVAIVFAVKEPCSSSDQVAPSVPGSSTAGGSSSSSGSSTAGGSSSFSGSTSFSTNYAINKAISTSRTIRDSSYGE